MKSIHVILAVLGGAIAGAATGLLLAPEKGDKTRREIARFLAEKSEVLKLKKREAEEMAEELADKLTEK